MFTPLSSYSEFDKSNRYLLFKNDSLGIASFTFWDFNFSQNKKELKKMKKKRVPFNNILLFAKTDDPAYEYYILLNNDTNSKFKDKYIYMDTIINNYKFTLIATKDIPKPDWKFIWKNFHSYK